MNSVLFGVGAVVFFFVVLQGNEKNTSTSNCTPGSLLAGSQQGMRNGMTQETIPDLVFLRGKPLSVHPNTQKVLPH